MSTHRTRSIVCDACFGATFEELSIKHDISIGRVGQIVASDLRSIGFQSLEVARRKPMEVCQRYRNLDRKRWPYFEVAATPEEFYAERETEPRIFKVAK